MLHFAAIPEKALFGQLLLGLINGSFYALLSMGLAIIFGLLNVINFAHGALYMLGAFVGWLALQYLGINYWIGLFFAPIVVAAFGILIERLLLRWVYDLDHLYGWLLTYGVTLVIEGTFLDIFGSTGQSYPTPAMLEGGFDLGFMYLPGYRAWVVLASLLTCLATWLLIEKTKLGAYLRAATERSDLVQTFGINVPRMVTLTYGLGVALAAFAGVLAAPINQVSPLMGSGLVPVVFAVVVVGGMGSIFGAVIAGFLLGLIEALTKVFMPQASGAVIFLVMIIVLLVRPAGLFGRLR